MHLNLPGLICDRRPSGVRWLVRQAGNKAKRTTIPDPAHPDFMKAYAAGRRGEKYTPDAPAIQDSLAWLVGEFEAYMADQVDADLLHPGTAKQRTAFYTRICKDYGDKSMRMPRASLIQIRDRMSKTPGAADNMVKAVRALYVWAIDRGLVTDNPAAGIGKLNKGTGAVPWSVADLRKFRERHPQGTMAHLAVTLFMFTACRVGDVVLLGRSHEAQRAGLTWLEWQPGKKGSPPVSVPILPPLARSIEAQKVIGPTYLLNGLGKPFASPAAFGNWFRDRVAEAGLIDRSPHGIRKACGELLALAGATQYHIMSIHGHTQAKTSEVYTRGANRRDLARDAFDKLSGMDW